MIFLVGYFIGVFFCWGGVGGGIIGCYRGFLGYIGFVLGFCRVFS